MQRISNWMGALALVVVMSSYCYSQNSAPITIVLPPVTGATGVALDNQSLLFPATVGVLEDPSGELELTIESVSSNADSVALNGTFTNTGMFTPDIAIFGVDSEGGADTPTQFDSAFEEQLEISFNQSLFIQEIDFDGLGFNNSGVVETFSVGDVEISGDGLPFTGAFDFTDGGTSDGLFLAADTPILLQVNGENASAGLDAITVRVAVPEPSSLLGLLGLAGLFAVKRRR